MQTVSKIFSYSLAASYLQVSLTLKKRPSKEHRGWQSEEKKIENAKQELELKKHPTRENRGWQDDSREQYREHRARATVRVFLRL